MDGWWGEGMEEQRDRERDGEMEGGEIEGWRKEEGKIKMNSQENQQTFCLK